jgi:hypothetical protein
MNGSGISVGGAMRLRKAIAAEVRRDYEKEIASAPNFWRRIMIQKKIQKEVRRRMGNLASPHSLYFSRRFFGGVE